MSRKLMALLPMLLFGVLLIAQTDTKLSKAEKKAARKAQQEENFKQLQELLESKAFVLEANTIANRYGNIINVSPSINFISAVDETGVIQFAFNNSFSLGLNGLGGITEEGTITKYEIIRKEKSLALKMRIFGTIYGTTDLFITINSDGNARAQMVTLRGGRLTFTGFLRPLDDSIVYKGNRTF